MSTLIIRTTIIAAIEQTLAQFEAADAQYEVWREELDKLEEASDAARQVIADWLGEQPVYIPADEWTVQVDHRQNLEYWAGSGYYRSQRDQFNVQSPPMDMQRAAINASKAYAEHRDNQPRVGRSNAAVAELKAYLAKFRASTSMTVTVPDKVIDLIPNNVPLS